MADDLAAVRGQIDSATTELAGAKARVSAQEEVVRLLVSEGAREGGAAAELKAQYGTELAELTALRQERAALQQRLAALTLEKVELMRGARQGPPTPLLPRPGLPPFLHRGACCAFGAGLHGHRRQLLCCPTGLRAR